MTAEAVDHPTMMAETTRNQANNNAETMHDKEPGNPLSDGLLKAQSFTLNSRGPSRLGGRTPAER